MSGTEVPDICLKGRSLLQAPYVANESAHPQRGEPELCLVNMPVQ